MWSYGCPHGSAGVEPAHTPVPHCLMQMNITRTLNPLRALSDFGQSVWLDYIRRDLLTTGGLKRLVLDDGVSGVTSNPSIFEKAVTAGSDYDDILNSADVREIDAKAIFERIAVRDIRDAADVLSSVYERSQRRDGYVSLEVSPALAHDTQGTIEEARRLWRSVGRPNLMIKVPATPEGVPAVRQLIGEGINVNVTLLFSQDVYERVAETYMAGLEDCAAIGGDVSRIAGVASFFVSRIDTAVDALLEARISNAADERERARLMGLKGRAAIANARQTYRKYQRLFGSARWQPLAAQGARPQRVLWASTGTKNPAYSDVLYVEELIGPDTVNTMPPATLDAFRDHGRPRASLTGNPGEADATMEALAQLGISMTEVTDRLLDDGVRLFTESFDGLLRAVERRGRGVAAAAAG
jgi:transaldolase/glucose-6-phosphate isomerase